jgi:hypothetical protein
MMSWTLGSTRPPVVAAAAALVLLRCCNADDEGTFVAAGGTPGAINRNVFGSLNNDLAFYLR